jgi:hypothetical protein
LQVAKANTPIEFKSLLQKVAKYESTIPQAKPEVVAEKTPFKELVSKLNLTSKETVALNKIATEKISLPELSKELNLQVAKADTPIEVKSLLQKFNKYESTIPQVKPEVDAEKIPLKEIVSKLNLSPKETEALNKITTEKVSLPELSKELKADATKPNAPIEVKSLLQKVAKYESAIPQVKPEVDAEKIPLKEIVSKLNLSPKETEALNKITTEKVSLPELSKELKADATKPNAPIEVKSLLQKVNKYESTIPQAKLEAVAEKEPLKKIASKLNLNSKEIVVLNKITTEKVSIPELSKDLKAEVQKPYVQQEVKTLEQKVMAYLIANKTNNLNVTLDDLSKQLNLTSSEESTLKSLNLEKADLKELKLSLTTEIVKNPLQTELKTLLTKIVNNPFTNNSSIKEVNGKSVDNSDLNKLDASRSIEKNILKNENPVKIANASATSTVEESSEYLVSIKSAKSTESLLFDGKLNLTSKTPELLKTSIYASKESSEFTKLRVIPINDEVAKKDEFRLSEDNNKKGFSRKVSSELNLANLSKDSGKTSSDGNYSSTNEENVNNKLNLAPQANVDEYTKKAFEKEIQASANIENKDSTATKSEKTSTASQSIDSKINEINFPKPTMVGHQIRNQSMAITEKVIYKQIDVKNIKEEISQLMQKGERKTVEFSLTPENLGKLQVKLEVINKVVSASIKVDNEMTQQIMQQSLEGLKTSLNQNGVVFNSLNVSLSDTEDKNNRFFKQKRKQNQEFKGNIQELDEQFVQKNLGYNKYDFIA